jgi:hypothetical protein
LAEALKSNHGLTTLNLWSNQIGDQGVLDLVQALQSNLTLIHLYIRPLDKPLFQSVNTRRHDIQLQSHLTMLTAYQRNDGLMSQYVDHWLLRRILHMSAIPPLTVD